MTIRHYEVGMVGLSTMGRNFVTWLMMVVRWLGTTRMPAYLLLHSTLSKTVMLTGLRKVVHVAGDLGIPALSLMVFAGV